MNYVQELTNEEKLTLKEMHKNHPLHLPRKRAHAILLSNQTYSVPMICDVYGVCRQTVASWFSKWEKHGICGLFDRPGRGRPYKLSLSQRDDVITKVKESPRSLRKILACIEKENSISLSTLKCLCKKAGLVWKRVRKSLRSKRNQEAFDIAHKEIEGLIEKHKKGDIELCYFDESGFTLEPCTSYAWQPVGETIEIPSSKSRRLNVLGFVNRDCQFDSFVFEGSVTTAVVVSCIDRFASQVKKPTTLIIDNAPTHTSHEFNDCIEGWKNKNLTIFRIPPYSPELNIIEMVWGKIKYDWLPFSAYDSYANLKQALFEILANIGKSYRIEFS
ncbi:hypothetical protein MNBD_GAMMA04-974 [hydrothermal vent metagenome]|uniref:Tc1-like transposase DDE domain-containing protein n=1 Tax=hydrothermal vent metagenome TaxID=652676 RepID=A0A3B0VYP1_9ZZZZ